MYQRPHRKLKWSPNVAREIRRLGILYSISTTARLRDLCFSSPVISATKTQKKSARKRFYPWLEIYFHFKVEAHFKHGCCGSPPTRRWIIGKKREPRNEVETWCTFQSMRLKPMTNCRLIRHLDIPVPMRCCRLPRHPAS